MKIGIKKVQSNSSCKSSIVFWNIEIPRLELFSREARIFQKNVEHIFKNVAKSRSDDLKLHFVCACEAKDYYKDRLKSIILNEMEKYGIESVLFTFICMQRMDLITKEQMENYCMGEEAEKESVNDDLEKFFEEIRLGKDHDEFVETYFLPKLTEEELELIAAKDPNYVSSFFLSANPDVRESQMEMSESESKFVRGQCYRKTIAFELVPSVPNVTYSGDKFMVINHRGT